MFTQKKYAITVEGIDLEDKELGYFIVFDLVASTKDEAITYLEQSRHWQSMKEPKIDSIEYKGNTGINLFKFSKKTKVVNVSGKSFFDLVQGDSPNE